MNTSLCWHNDENNPPAAADAPELARFAKIGLVPGQDFDASKLNADFVKRIPQVGFDRIMVQFKLNKELKDIHGWMFTTKTGLYGTDYLMRALVTAIGLGANRPQDAIYPTSQKDADGRAYDGANKYVMHFPKGQLPPVRGFWSVTMLMPTISSSTTRSIAIRSVLVKTPRPTRTARSISTCRRIHRSGPGVELASGAGRRVHPDVADVLA